MKGEEQVRMIGLAWRPPVVSFFCSSFVSSLHFLFLPPSLVAAFINWRTFPLFRHELPFHGVNGCHPVAQLLALKSVAFPIECSSRSRSPGANKIRPSIVVTMRLTRSFNQSQPHRSAPNRTKSHQIAPNRTKSHQFHPGWKRFIPLPIIFILVGIDTECSYWWWSLRSNLIQLEFVKANQLIKLSTTIKSRPKPVRFHSFHRQRWPSARPTEIQFHLDRKSNRGRWFNDYSCQIWSSSTLLSYHQTH